MLYPDTPLKTDGLMEEFIIYTEKNKVIKSERIFPSLEIGEQLQHNAVCGEQRGAIVCTQWRAERKLQEREKKREGDGDRESNRINYYL